MIRLAKIIRDLLLTAAILLCLGLVVVRLDGARQETISGQPRAIDGDTLMLDGRRIRLAGIDAPELRQVCRRDGQGWPCGRDAKVHLAVLIGNADAACVAGGSDRYGRLLAVCRSGGREINAAMVSAGYAIAFGNYEREELEAKEKRLGLWAGTFDPPRTWRQTHGGISETPHIPDGWLVASLSRLGEWLGNRIVGSWNE